MAKKKPMPKQIYIYVSDWVDREPVYAVARSLEEVPEDVHPIIGVYELVREARMIVTRDLA